MSAITDPHPLLEALGEQLAPRAEAFELVVIGGSGLLALGIIDRPTQDVDVVALMDHGGLRSADPLPQALLVARERVGRDFDVEPDWLNPGPSDMVYAVVDQGGGKHLDDLRALQPTPDELIRAALWTRTHDPSPGHRETLEQVLAHFGVTGADLGT